MLFSIITICYNSEKTIERTIKSVLAQSCKDYEYLIIDGASKDSTLDIIKKYEPQFNGRLKWSSEPDTGIYNAMNKGIERSSGKIIGIVNSDDWLASDSLATLENILKEDSDNSNKILTGEVLFHYQDGTTQHYSTSKERYKHFSKQYRMGLNHPATFVPKSIYDRIGLFDERFKLYADADFVLKCFEANVDMVFIDKVLSNMSDGGASNNRSQAMFDDALLLIKLHSKNSFDRCWRTVRCYIKWTLKGIIPEWYVRRYRARHN